MEDLYIDVGYDSKEQLADLVNVGDLATINRKVVRLAGSLMAGKAMDDRAGVAVMLECLKALANMNHIADVYAVATVQEEVGETKGSDSSSGKTTSSTNKDEFSSTSSSTDSDKPSGGSFGGSTAYTESLKKKPETDSASDKSSNDGTTKK